MFGFSLANNHPASEEEKHRSVFINGIESGATSQHVSPWTSRAVSPVSSPGTSVVHGDYGFPQPGRSPADKKRVSWLTSLPASHWTSNRVPHYGEGSSPPTASPRGGKNLNLRTSSSSSSSSSMVRPNFGPRANGGTAGASDADKEVTPASLVPNAQFLGLMLLMILLISSPLIKILSVVLFVGVLVVDSD